MTDPREIEDLAEDEAQKELDRLQKVLSEADLNYHQKDAPTITDAAYDALKLRYLQIETAFPQLKRDDSRQDYVFLAEVVGHYLGDIFPGTKILGYWAFRVTRNSELYIDEEEVANLLKAVENELHNRRKGDAVRLEVEKDCPEEIRESLLATLRLSEDDLYVLDGPINPTRDLRGRSFA